MKRLGKFHIHSLTRRSYKHTVLWASFLCAAITVGISLLGRAAHNFRAALTEKPDVTIYLLLPEEELGETTLLRESETERDYLAETKDGPKLIKMKKGEQAWFVSFIEPLHESHESESSMETSRLPE